MTVIVCIIIRYQLSQHHSFCSIFSAFNDDGYNALGAWDDMALRRKLQLLESIFGLSLLVARSIVWRWE